MANVYIVMQHMINSKILGVFWNYGDANRYVAEIISENEEDLEGERYSYDDSDGELWEHPSARVSYEIQTHPLQGFLKKYVV